MCTDFLVRKDMWVKEQRVTRNLRQIFFFRFTETMASPAKDNYRMKSYKNKALNPEEMRRRREEEGIQLRKQKREQQVTVILTSLCTALTQPGLCCCQTGIFKDLCIKVCWQSSYFSCSNWDLAFLFFCVPSTECSSHQELSKHFVLGVLEVFVHRSLFLSFLVVFF